MMNRNKYLNQNQQDWLIRRYNKRQDAHVLVGFPEGAILFSNRDWETPRAAQYYRKYAQPYQRILDSWFHLASAVVVVVVASPSVAPSMFSANALLSSAADELPC